MNVVLTTEADLGAAEEGAIQTLLIAAFPQYAEIWRRQSFWGGPAEFRLTMRQYDRPVAHLGFARRLIEVGGHPVRIAGVGAVATDPKLQGQGLGKRLFIELKGILLNAPDAGVDFAFLGCREAVVGFYQKSGFTRFNQPAQWLDPNTQLPLTHPDFGPHMVMPIGKPLEAWPTGLIDLKGMPW